MVTIAYPEERECERCGRQDVWDAEEGTWRILEADGEKRYGSPYCLHEWDINGNFNPVAAE